MSCCHAACGEDRFLWSVKVGRQKLSLIVHLNHHKIRSRLLSTPSLWTHVYVGYLYIYDGYLAIIDICQSWTSVSHGHLSAMDICQSWTSVNHGHLSLKDMCLMDKSNVMSPALAIQNPQFDATFLSK